MGDLMKKTDKTLIELVRKLKKRKEGFYQALARYLSAARRKRIAVNIAKIDKIGKEGELIVVPGKVLGNGLLTKNISVCAYSFSKSAEKKIKERGNIVSWDELIEKNMRGRIII